MKKARKLNYIHFVITYNFVLLIPMIIVFCSVFIMEGRQQVQKIETMLSIILTMRRSRPDIFWILKRI